MVKARIISLAKYSLFLCIGLALLYLSFKDVDLKNTFHEIGQAKPGFILISVALSILAFISRAYRWNILIEPLGYTPRLTNTSYSLLVGYLANLALPRLGEVSRCGSLTKAENVPFDELLGTVIVERVIDVLSLLICILITACIEYERLGNFLIQNLLMPFSEKIQLAVHSPLVIIGLIIFITASVVVIRMMKKKSGKTGLLAKASSLLKGIVEGLKAVRKIKRPFAFIAHSILIWVLYFFASYICFFALPATSDLNWKAGMFVLVVGGIGMSAPVQGGIGIFHLLISQGLLLYSIPYAHGLAFATLLHSTQTILVILLGLFSFIMLFLAGRKSANDKFVSHRTASE